MFPIFTTLKFLSKKSINKLILHFHNDANQTPCMGKNVTESY